jgi:hypothetical protein
MLQRSASAANHSVLYFVIFLTFTVDISLAQPTPAVRALHYEQCTACTAWSRNLCQLRNHRRACPPAIICYPAEVWMTDLATRRLGSLEGRRPVSHGRLQCFGVQSREANFDIVIRPAFCSETFLQTPYHWPRAKSSLVMHCPARQQLKSSAWCFVMFTSPTLWPLLPLLYRPILV